MGKGQESGNNKVESAAADPSGPHHSARPVYTRPSPPYTVQGTRSQWFPQISKQPKPPWCHQWPS